MGQVSPFWERNLNLYLLYNKIKQGASHGAKSESRATDRIQVTDPVQVTGRIRVTDPSRRLFPPSGAKSAPGLPRRCGAAGEWAGSGLGRAARGGGERKE